MDRRRIRPGIDGGPCQAGRTAGTERGPGDRNPGLVESESDPGAGGEGGLPEVFSDSCRPIR